jgi:tetratricopeptide (TPR) repeat protein
MQNLELQDRRYLEAAEGWLGLGDFREANEELECITPQMRAHPDVLRMRWNVYAQAKKWEMASEVARGISIGMPDFPFGWIHWAYSLHELNRTKEAYDVVNSVVAKFPAEYLMRYNLACYSCRLGNLKEALQWLQLAIDLAGKKDIRLMALNDPDLEPLWRKIGEI